MTHFLQTHRRLAVVLTLCHTLAAAAQDLLKDPAFESLAAGRASAREWTVKAAKPPERKSIEAFQGMPGTLFYLSGSGQAVIKQPGVRVEPGKWYAFSAFYKNNSQNSNSGWNLYFGAAAPGGGDWDSFSHRAFGGAKDWVRPGIFFNSGGRSEIDLVIMLMGDGEWALGGPELIPLDGERLAAEKFVLDGDFENCSPGMIPCDFRGTGKTPVSPRVAPSQGFPGGKFSMSLPVSPGSKALFAGPSLIAGGGDRVTVSLYAKSQVPGAKLFISANGEKFRKESGVDLTEEFKRVEMEFTAPPPGGRDPSGLRELTIFLRAMSPAPAEIFVDQFKILAASGKEGGAKSSRKNLIPLNSSFESGYQGWEWTFAETPGGHRDGGRVSTDSGNAGEGSFCLKIETPVSPGAKNSIPMFKDSFALLSAFFDAPPMRPYTISFMAKSEPPGASLRAGMFFAAGKEFKLTGDFSRYSCVVSPQRDRGMGRSYVQFSAPLDGSSIYLDAVQVETGGRLTGFEPGGDLEVGAVFDKKLYPIFVSGEKVHAVIFLVSRFPEDRDFELSWEISDYLGAAADKKSLTARIPAGKTITLPAEFYSAGKGYFSVRLTLTDTVSKAGAEAEQFYAVVPEPGKLDAAKSWFGVYSAEFFAARGSGDWASLMLRGGSYREFLKTLKNCGFKWLRKQTVGQWRCAEIEKGKPVWKFDRPVGMIKDAGMGLLCDFGSYHDFPAWSDTGVPLEEGGRRANYPKMEDLAGFAAAFAEHYRGKVDAAQLFNETGRFSAEEFVRAAAAVWPAFKRNAPEMIQARPTYPASLLPQPDGGGNDWVDKVFRLGLSKYMDVCDIHPYLRGHAYSLARVDKGPFESLVTSPEGTQVRYLETRINHFKKTHGNFPVWDTESGNIFPASAKWMRAAPDHVQRDWYTNEVAAGRMVRWGVVKMAAGISRNFYFMFSFTRNLGHYHCLDLVNKDMTPRAGVPAWAQFAKKLDGSVFHRKLEIGKDTWIYVFSNDGKSVAVYWNYNLENKKPGVFSLPDAEDDLEAEDIMGNAVKTERKDGKVVLPLMSTPVYLTSAKLSPEALAEKLSSAAVSGTVDCAPRAGLGNFQGRPAMIARVENPRPSAVDSVALRGSASGCLSLPGGAETVLTQIPGGGAGEVFFSLCVSPGRGSLELAAALEGAIYSARKNDILCGVFRRAAAGRPPREAISLDDPAQIIERVRPDGQKPLAEKYSKLKTPSAKIFAAWTETSLSLKAEVKDNFIKTSPPGSELYQGDCVEFYFDFVPEKTFARLPEYGDFCLKLAAAPAEKGDTPRLVMEKNGRTVTDFALFNIADVKANSELTENGYIIELAIPLRNIKLTAGSVIGFNAQLISSGEKKEDKFHLMWNGKDCWNAPGDFGVILLSE